MTEIQHIIDSSTRIQEIAIGIFPHLDEIGFSDSEKLKIEVTIFKLLAINEELVNLISSHSS